MGELLRLVYRIEDLKGWTTPVDNTWLSTLSTVPNVWASHPSTSNTQFSYHSIYCSNTTTVLRPFVRDHPGDPVPEETCTSCTYADYQPCFISFLYLLHSIFLFNLMCLTVFLHHLSPGIFGLPLGLEPSTSYSMHFFRPTQSMSSYGNTCPYHRNLFCCSTEIDIYSQTLSIRYSNKCFKNSIAL